MTWRMNSNASARLAAPVGTNRLLPPIDDPAVVPPRPAGITAMRTFSAAPNLRSVTRSFEPLVYIDGMPVNMYGNTTSVDDLIRPDDLEGIEVYGGASVPIQFVRDGPQGSNCGAVMLWTKLRV